MTLAERVYRRAAGTPTADPDAAIASTAGSMGAPLPDTARATFESSLGTDLSTVRVHTGDASAAAADGLGARAFATGQDIHFGAGEYRPEDPFGQHLLAHEVAHTVQQRGGGGGPQTKLEVTEPGDAFEVEADRAADAMITGTPTTIGGGSATRVARKEEDSAAPEAKSAAPVWVEFTKDGAWDGQQVVTTLSSIASVPEDLKAAILAGPKPTASYCVALRGRVNTAGADPAKHDECELISNSLNSRINELVYATSRSPLQYRQLADVATWSTQYVDAAPAAAPAADAAPAAPASGPAGSSEAETYATRLAVEAGGRVRTGDAEVIRNGKMQQNDGHTGEASGSPALAGWTFLHDPFDNTVLATRPDGSGIQFTYQVTAGAEEGAAQVTELIHTEELPKLRVLALKRMEKAAPGRAQEGATGPADRLARDVQVFKDATAAYEKAQLDYQEKLKTDPKAKPPKLAKPSQNKTTACTDTPTDVYHAGGGSKRGFPFTPPTWKSFHKFTPGGANPKPGDVYWLFDIDKNQVAHMGVVKSRTPVAGHDGFETWVVTDGGQGGYSSIQMEQERTRGPYNVATGIFTSNIAEAGQSVGARRLIGWVDIEEYDADPEMK